MKALVKISFMVAVILFVSNAATAKENGHNVKPVSKEISAVNTVNVAAVIEVKNIILNQEELMKNSFVMDINEVEKKYYTKRAFQRSSRTKKFYC